MSKKMISFEISDELREALRVKAFQENVSVSEIMRKTLSEALFIDNLTKTDETKDKK